MITQVGWNGALWGDHWNYVLGLTPPTSSDSEDGLDDFDFVTDEPLDALSLMNWAGIMKTRHQAHLRINAVQRQKSRARQIRRNVQVTNLIPMKRRHKISCRCGHRHCLTPCACGC